MDWNITQNFSSNIVFGILLFAMIIYWISLSLLEGQKSDTSWKIECNCSKYFVVFYSLFTMDCCWLFSIK